MSTKRGDKRRAPMAGRPASPKAFSGSGFHSSRGYAKRERAGARHSSRRGPREESL